MKKTEMMKRYEAETEGGRMNHTKEMLGIAEAKQSKEWHTKLN